MPNQIAFATHAAFALCSATALLGLPSAHAQTSMSSAPTYSSAGAPTDPNPYYLGVGEALTHDSNVYRIPGGRSDNYSSTSLNAGFSQPISRQRVFGAASVSANRYQNESTLNNTSYALNVGANWETVWQLAGDLNASMGRSLSAPVANAASLVPVRNVADMRNVEAAVRWGGASLLTLEASGGWSSVDYAGLDSAAADSRQSRAGFAVHFRPGGPLTLGLAGRFNKTESPNAFGAGSAVSNSVDGRNVDFLAGYDVANRMTASGRLSYTRQISSDTPAEDFSGLTGGVSLNWQPTQKISIHFDAARDAGSGPGLYGMAAATLVAAAPPLINAPSTAPTNVFYENSRLTDSVSVGATHATTARISLNASARYAQARIIARPAMSGVSMSLANTTDASKLATFGAAYGITRNWNLGCSLSREWREVSGGVNFAYRASIASCSTQLTLR